MSVTFIAMYARLADRSRDERPKPVDPLYWELQQRLYELGDLLWDIAVPQEDGDRDRAEV